MAVLDQNNSRLIEKSVEKNVAALNLITKNGDAEFAAPLPVTFFSLVFRRRLR